MCRLHVSLIFLVGFYFHIDEFLKELPNLNFAGCGVLSWSRQQGPVKSRGLSSQRAPGYGRTLTGMARVMVHPSTPSWVPLPMGGYSSRPT
jgi:hypothetical protein